jgi:hypothetical protein
MVAMIKSRRIRQVGHVVCMGEMRNAYKILVGNPEGQETTWKTGIDGMILKWTLGK